MVKKCPRCGTINIDDAELCIICGYYFNAVNDEENREKRDNDATDLDIKYEKPVARFKSANLVNRIVAYLIDILTITIVIFSVFRTLQLDPLLIPFGIGFMAFLYFVSIEYVFNTTLGKYFVELLIINQQGGSPTLESVVISALGKTFLLPLDLVIGYYLIKKGQIEREFFVNSDQGQFLRATQYYTKLIVVQTSQKFLQEHIKKRI